AYPLSPEPRGSSTSPPADPTGRRAVPGVGGNRGYDPRRPPRLNIAAVKEAEARGSLTSLPDLIRRATTLATALDRGRPASRFDAGQPPSAGDEKSNQILSPPGQRGSISDLLASFPPPAATPHDGSGSRSSRPTSWPSPASASSVADADEKGSRRPHRRCCGVPLWVLVLVLIGLLAVAAAVVVPVALIVLPRQSQDAAKAQLERCQRDVQCENGGNAALKEGACRCVCAGGFTGDRCAVRADDGCVTTDVRPESGEPIRNVRIGSSIPRLLEEGPTDFRVPLNATALLAAFAAADMSCGGENALVTFNGRSERLPSASQRPGSATITARQESTGTPSVIMAPTAASGAVGDVLLVDTPTATGLVLAPSATASPGAPSNSTPLVVDENALEFARVSVLFILQRRSVDVAVAAQAALQVFLGSDPLTAVTRAGGGISVNFQNFTLSVGDETVGGVSARRR
ncbi:MAG: hypothetical protein M1832_000363, partial [Thelocarpon impressellum]